MEKCFIPDQSLKREMDIKHLIESPQSSGEIVSMVTERNRNIIHALQLIRQFNSGQLAVGIRDLIVEILTSMGFRTTPGNIQKATQILVTPSSSLVDDPDVVDSLYSIL